MQVKGCLWHHTIYFLTESNVGCCIMSPPLPFPTSLFLTCALSLSPPLFFLSVNHSETQTTTAGSINPPQKIARYLQLARLPRKQTLFCLNKLKALWSVFTVNSNNKTHHPRNISLRNVIPLAAWDGKDWDRRDRTRVRARETIKRVSNVKAHMLQTGVCEYVYANLCLCVRLHLFAESSPSLLSSAPCYFCHLTPPRAALPMNNIRACHTTEDKRARYVPRVREKEQKKEREGSVGDKEE